MTASRDRPLLVSKTVARSESPRRMLAESADHAPHVPTRTGRGFVDRMGPADGRPRNDPHRNARRADCDVGSRWQRCRTTRKGTAESHCAAIVCDVTGTSLEATCCSPRAASPMTSPPTLQARMGYVQLTGYRTWSMISASGTGATLHQSFTTYPSMQLRCGPWATLSWPGGTRGG